MKGAARRDRPWILKYFKKLGTVWEDERRQTTLAAKLMKKNSGDERGRPTRSTMDFKIF